MVDSPVQDKTHKPPPVMNSSAQVQVSSLLKTKYTCEEPFHALSIDIYTYRLEAKLEKYFNKRAKRIF